MTEIKPGDKVKWSHAAETPLIVVAVHPESGYLWANTEVDSHPLTYKISDVKKIEPFFEEGKAYISVDKAKFEVVLIREDSDGDRVAFGLTLYGDGSSVWGVKRSYDGWTEAK